MTAFAVQKACAGKFDGSRILTVLGAVVAAIGSTKHVALALCVALLFWNYKEVVAFRQAG